MENTERKYGIGKFVLAQIGKGKIKGRVSKQTESLIKTHEYYIHTIIGTFLVDDEYIFEYSENN